MGRAHLGHPKTERPALPVKGMRVVLRPGYPEAENLLLRSSSFGHRQLMRLRLGLGSSGFHSQMVCDHSVRQYERCKSIESRINLLRRHVAALVRRGRGTRLVSSIQAENDQSSTWRRQYRRPYSHAQEASFYPQPCTFFTFPQSTTRPELEASAPEFFATDSSISHPGSE